MAKYHSNYKHVHKVIDIYYHRIAQGAANYSYRWLPKVSSWATPRKDNYAKIPICPNGEAVASDRLVAAQDQRKNEEHTCESAAHQSRGMLTRSPMQLLPYRIEEEKKEKNAQGWDRVGNTTFMNS